MKKHIFWSIILTASVLVVILRINRNYEADRIQSGIADSIIRFHVRANSDSDNDQELKLKVKDAVTDYISKELAYSDSLDESREILLKESDSIRTIAENVIIDNGYDYDVSVYMTRDYFPVKVYGDYTFPQGEYEAFRIDIGAAKGRNWWCVLYPPLCFVDSVYGVVPEQSKKQLSDVLNEDEMQTVTGKSAYKKKGCKTVIRFKLVDEVKKLF